MHLTEHGVKVSSLGFKVQLLMHVLMRIGELVLTTKLLLGVGLLFMLGLRDIEKEVNGVTNVIYNVIGWQEFYPQTTQILNVKVAH